MTAAEIIDDVLEAEGSRYTNDPADPSGPTRWGITQRTLGWWRGRRVTAHDVRGLGEEEARAIYEELYIVGPGFDQLPATLQPFVIDTGVHFGQQAATKQLQQAVGAKVDGHLGPKTRRKVRDMLRTPADWDRLRVELIRIRLDAYVRQVWRSVAAHDRDLRAVVSGASSLRRVKAEVAAIGSVGKVTKLRFLRGWIARPLKFLP